MTADRIIELEHRIAQLEHQVGELEEVVTPVGGRERRLALDGGPSRRSRFSQPT